MHISVVVASLTQSDFLIVYFHLSWKCQLLMCWWEYWHNIISTTYQWHVTCQKSVQILQTLGKIHLRVWFFACIFHSFCPKEIKNAIKCKMLEFLWVILYSSLYLRYISPSTAKCADFWGCRWFFLRCQKWWICFPHIPLFPTITDIFSIKNSLQMFLIVGCWWREEVYLTGSLYFKAFTFFVYWHWPFLVL